jgi:hypothetical protein|uniref:Uncharacterized protein n=1 Tax=viral metagenome TaxID=1070528 RepID=A0A6C0C086_9ZZZZ
MIRYLFILLLLLAVAYILKHYNRNLEGMAGETCNMTDDKKPGYVDVIKSGSQRYSEIYTSCNEAITRWNKTCLTNCSNPTKIDGNCGRHLFRKDNTNFKKCAKKCDTNALSEEYNEEQEKRKQDPTYKNICLTDQECKESCAPSIIYKAANTDGMDFDKIRKDALRGQQWTKDIYCGSNIFCPNDISGDCCGSYDPPDDPFISLDDDLRGFFGDAGGVSQREQVESAARRGGGSLAGAFENSDEEEEDTFEIDGSVANVNRAAGGTTGSAGYNSNTMENPENTSEKSANEYGNNLMNGEKSEIDCSTYPNHPKCEYTNNMFGCIGKMDDDSINSMIKQTEDIDTLDSSWGLFK